MSFRGKFCPVCQIRNDVLAQQCIYCGAVFVDEPPLTQSTMMVAGPEASGPEEVFRVDPDITAVPHGSLLIYVMGGDTPVRFEQPGQLVLGRKSQTDPPNLFDLTPYGAARMGVSRMHARLQFENGRFTVTDLVSTNGTWINKERLAPGTPCPLTGIDILLLGRLKMLVISGP
ncbi:MAG: FHA domain-containing protein [Chloroflexota bacterium]